MLRESPAVRGCRTGGVGQRRAPLPIPCLEDSDCDGHPAWFVHALTGSCRRTRRSSRRASRTASRRPACRPHFRRRGCGDAHPYTDAGPSERWPTTLTASRREFRGERQAPPPVAALARRRFVVARFLRGGAWRSSTWAMCSSTTRSASAG
uniref:Uncharacterized protein n=1 Tax=Escherichia coli TaxID=562 RepID=A0A5P1MRM3_ECOLX|nr:hypothetical protein p13ZX28-272_00255 [Escherichia coli]